MRARGFVLAAALVAVLGAAWLIATPVYVPALLHRIAAAVVFAAPAAAIVAIRRTGPGR